MKKATTTFACAFALLLCYVGCTATPAFAGLHPWIKAVAVAIGPIHRVADDDPEGAAVLKQRTRETFEAVYAGNDPRITVTGVADPVYVEVEDVQEPALFLKRAFDFDIIAEERVGFIGAGALSDTQGWGLIYIVNEKLNRVYILIADLEREAPNEQRS